jgi:ABC-type dipeptide/oligopeptide/nickel transport system ATPase component
MNIAEKQSLFSAVKGKNPFPGLRPFQADEAHLFFGRERYVETIIDKLNQYHFVSIVGNSGSGKSSLLRAGVIPKLMAQQEWIILTMRPGKNPVEELNHTLSEEKALKLPSGLDESLRILRQSELGLVQLLRNAIPAHKKVLIVVDQFEELFRFNREHQEIAFQFVNLLLKGIQQQDVPINIIITLRSDFIGDCEQFIGLPEAINNGQFLIPRMKRDELQLSITGPIEYAGQRISPRLVQQLVKDVGSNPDQLPILQHVLMRTWDVWVQQNDEHTPIDLMHYEQTGKMEKALSNHAEEAMVEIETDEQRAIVSILFKTLTVKESDNRGVRRPTGLAKIAEIANTNVSDLTNIVNVFRSADRGFLMPPANVPLHENSMVDISHESLMRVWERLAIWVEEEYASAQIYQRITASAILYEKGLSGLWRDPDLQIALDWDQKTKVTKQWSEQYNPHYELSKRFVEASLQQKNFLIAERRRKRKVSRMLVLSALVVLS